MKEFQCPHCLGKYKTTRLLEDHMENDERMDAAWVARWVVLNYPQESSPSEFKAELRDEPSPTLTEVNEPPPAVSRFRVWFVVDGDNLHRREIPKEETFQGFCSQLKSLYYQTDREFDIDEFEFILIEKRFHRREVAEPFTDADSYYRMVRKLLGIPSHWRHAIVRKKTTPSTPIKLPPLVNPYMPKLSTPSMTYSDQKGLPMRFQPARAPPAPPTNSATAVKNQVYGADPPVPVHPAWPSSTYHRPIAPAPAPIPIPAPLHASASAAVQLPMPVSVLTPAQLSALKAQDQAQEWAVGLRLQPIMPAITFLKPTCTLMPPLLPEGRPRLPRSTVPAAPTPPSLPLIMPAGTNSQDGHERTIGSFFKDTPSPLSSTALVQTGAPPTREFHHHTLRSPLGFSSPIMKLAKEQVRDRKPKLLPMAKKKSSRQEKKRKYIDLTTSDDDDDDATISVIDEVDEAQKAGESTIGELLRGGPK